MIDVLIAFGGGIIFGAVATVLAFAAILKWIDKIIKEDEDLKNE